MNSKINYIRIVIISTLLLIPVSLSAIAADTRQENLAGAQDKYTQAIVRYNKALIALDEALGLLLQRRNLVVE